MRPAIGDFHIFPALRLAVMPSPYVTEITPEMQQKIRIFAERYALPPAPAKKTPFGVFFCVLYSFGDFVSAALPLGLPAGKLAAAVGLAVQAIFMRKRDGPLIAALFLKIRG